MNIYETFLRYEVALYYVLQLCPMDQLGQYTDWQWASRVSNMALSQSFLQMLGQG